MNQYEIIKLLIDLGVIVLFPIGGYVVKSFLNGIQERFDEVIDKLESMNKSLHELELDKTELMGRIENIEGRLQRGETRMDSHSNRLRELELKNK